MRSLSKRVGKQVLCDEGAEAAPGEEWLDGIVRLSLQFAVGNAGPTAASWSEIQDKIEARPQPLCCREDESRGCKASGVKSYRRWKMLSWREVLAHQERYNDLLRDAEKDAVLLRELALAERRDRFHCRLLTWVGRRLVSWGSSLQERYGTVVEAPSIKPVNPTQYADEWRCLQTPYGAPAEIATLQAAHRTQYVAQPECLPVGQALPKEEGRYCSSRRP